MAEANSIERDSRFWSKAEDDVLIKDYPHGRTQALSLLLGRSTRGIRQRARLLGVHKVIDRTYYRFPHRIRYSRALQLHYHGPEALRLADLMYADAGDLFMKRKREIVDRYRQRKNPRPDRRLTFNGETRTLSNWSRKLGMTLQTLHSRLRRGWDEARTFVNAQRCQIQ